MTEEKKTDGTVKDYFLTKALDWICSQLAKPLVRLWKKWKWNKSLRNSCENAENIPESFAKKLSKSPAIKRLYNAIEKGTYRQRIYQDMVLAVAVELCPVNLEKHAKSLGYAILDSWFEKNDISYQEIKNSGGQMDLENILNDREKIYYTFFKSYEDEFGPDIIRVYYPRNGESWIEWDKKCCADVRCNFASGMEGGFCRIGFDYTKVDGEDERYLKGAYLNAGREVFRFKKTDLSVKELNRMFWAR